MKINMYNKNIIKLIILIIMVGGSIVYFIMQNNNEIEYENVYIANNEVVEDNSENIIKQEFEKIKVHISGEVKNPGIYELESGSRIQDAIDIAGGQSEQADLDKVNLAYELEDGQKIKIPGIFELESEYIYSDSGENVIVSDKNVSVSKSKININKATAEELEKISGVGPSLASKIILYREQNGKFEDIEDLKNVSGIGDRKFETIKEYIVVK